MDKSISIQLVHYYLQRGIHPEQFACPHQDFCRTFAYQNDMTEAKMSTVGSHYESTYPKVVVISLDPPYGNQGDFVKPEQRTTTYVTAKHEADDYSVNRPNPHWALTQMIVKDLLCLFGYKAQVGAAVVTETYAGRPIENVTAFFAHINVAKCSMNNPGKGQANPKVHKICGNSYLREELAILAPDLLITQGNATNTIISNLLLERRFQGSDLPTARQITLGRKSSLWLLMRHPARQVAKIRQDWTFYVHAVQEWHKAQTDSAD
jgi:hypothetical protein